MIEKIRLVFQDTVEKEDVITQTVPVLSIDNQTSIDIYPTESTPDQPPTNGFNQELRQPEKKRQAVTQPNCDETPVKAQKNNTDILMNYVSIFFFKYFL